jgi:succinylglutamate desuccinylase
MKLHEISQVPDGLLTAEAGDLCRILPGPTLLHLGGQKAGTVFIAVLLHGNEDTGLKAVQQVLKAYAGRPLPRSVSIFFGNLEAARFGVRHLEGQPDYNRIWPGCLQPELPEARLMARVVDSMRDREVFASIDIHNNTGLNPLYGCVTELSVKALQLARLFSRTVVWFLEPVGVSTAAMATLAPALTIECGKPGVPANEQRAAEFLDAILCLSAFPAAARVAEDLDIFHSVATLKVPDNVSFSFDGTPADIRFIPGLDHLNFRELEAETLLAETTLAKPLNVLQECSDEDGFHAFLQTEEGELRLKRATMPAMLTLDKQIVRQDCLCYLMERVFYSSCSLDLD